MSVNTVDVVNVLSVIAKMKREYLSSRISKSDIDNIKSSILSQHGEQFVIDNCRDAVKECNDKILCILNRTVLNSCITDSDNIASLLCKAYPLEQFCIDSVIHNIIDKSCDEIHFSELYPRIVSRIATHPFIGELFMKRYTELLTERYYDTNGDRTREQLLNSDCPEHSNENYIDMRIKSRHTQLIKHIGILRTLNHTTQLFDTVMDNIRNGNSTVNDIYELFMVIKTMYNRTELLDIINSYLNRSSGRDKFRLEELMTSLNNTKSTVVVGTKVSAPVFKNSVPQPYIKYNSKRNQNSNDNQNMRNRNDNQNMRNRNDNQNMRNRNGNQNGNDSKRNRNGNQNGNSKQIQSSKNVYSNLSNEIVTSEVSIEVVNLVTVDEIVNVLKLIEEPVREFSVTNNEDDANYYLNELINKGHNELVLSIAYVLYAIDSGVLQLPKKVKENCINYSGAYSLLSELIDSPNLKTVYTTLIQKSSQ